MTTVGRALRRRHWLVWFGLLVGCAAALAASVLRSPSYQATAVLALDETQATNQGFDIALQADQYLTQRYISMATSQPVLAAVCAREGPGCDPVALSRRVSATALKTTGLLGVSATASSPVAAARLANEVSQEVVARNLSEVDSYLGPQSRLLQSQLSQLDAQIAEVQRSLQAAQTPPLRTDAAVGNAIAPLLVQLQQLQTQYGTTYAKLQDVQVLQTRLGSSLLIEQPATPPLAPADPDPVRYLLVGAAGGLSAGFLGALVLARYRDRLGDRGELAEATGTPVVVSVDGRERASSSAYGFLAQGPVGQVGSPELVLVAASAGEPVDEVGLAMAEAVIERHRRVLVVPTAPVAPNGHAWSAPDKPPSSDIVVRAGGAADGPLLGQPDGFDLTIRCLPGPFWLTRGAGPAILVATRGRTRARDARRTSQALRQAGVEPAAAILLAPDAVRQWRRRRAAAAAERLR